MAIDLSDVPIIDQHCHGLYVNHSPATVEQWRPHFSESSDQVMRTRHVADTLYYRRLTREFAAFLNCEPNDEAVVAARHARDSRELHGSLLRAANIDTLCIDRGFPAKNNTAPDDAFVGDSATKIAPILRLEVLLQELITDCPTLESLEEAFRQALEDVRGQGYVGLKTIVAYRTGLNIEEWERDEVVTSFRQARREFEERGSLRIAHKPLLDSMLHLAFAIASAQELPMQLHTGYGDSDCNMLLANPFHLRAVLHRTEYRGMSFVLLHECYPYTQEGAFLAAVYHNVYLDISYGIPMLSYGEMLHCTRQALGTAPFSKVLYSSDGAGLPEIHWASALHGRRVLGEALQEVVCQGDLTTEEATQAGTAILRDNARLLYGLA
jgi:predicted TIM-barrel fold metal-dependent hydrolase